MIFPQHRSVFISVYCPKTYFCTKFSKRKKTGFSVNLSCLFWSMGVQQILFLPDNVAIFLILDLTKNKYNCKILKKGAEASVVLISITHVLYHVRAYATIVSCSLYMNQAPESLFLHNAKLTQKFIWPMCYPLKSHDCRIKYSISNVRSYINVVVKLCND